MDARASLEYLRILVWEKLHEAGKDRPETPEQLVVRDERNKACDLWRSLQELPRLHAGKPRIRLEVSWAIDAARRREARAGAGAAAQERKG